MWVGIWEAYGHELGHSLVTDEVLDPNDVPPLDTCRPFRMPNQEAIEWVPGKRQHCMCGEVRSKPYRVHAAKLDSAYRRSPHFTHQRSE